MASSRSEENVNLRHFPTQDGVTALVSPAILLGSCGFLLLWQMFSALFTSILIEPAINIIEQQLKEDKDLHSKTNMKIHHIISLVRFCLNNSYFSFQGGFYQQTEGAAMGSPISPIVANLFMEDLEVQAIRTSPTQPSLWKRFVVDTFTIIKKEDRSSFLQHLNSIHQKHQIHL